VILCGCGRIAPLVGRATLIKTYGWQPYNLGEKWACPVCIPTLLEIMNSVLDKQIELQAQRIEELGKKADYLRKEWNDRYPGE
jgi:hypothetical protein